MPALTPGTRLGPYEILAAIGAGGMGEVYRARDTRLGRDVAVKVLPQHLSAEPEIRARFEREAKTVSSLNHPNICTLFDVGREGETDYLVMELIEGDTLAERLKRGPMTSAELLRFGTQISDALDRAHRANVVHRDLKPGNVMITRSGAKLMDFGLSRVTGMSGTASGSGRTVTALTQSPTMAQALTAEGTLLGTFQYLAPEQLEGKEADARSDIWALGCVLYEMATGRRAFEGRSQASLIAAILERTPAPVAEAPSGAGGTATSDGPPPGIERLIRNCLAKDPEERIQTAHDVKLQLQGIAEGAGLSATSIAASQVSAQVAAVHARHGAGARLAWAVAGVALLAAAGVTAWTLSRPTPPSRVVRFRLSPVEGTTDYFWPRVSPDGRFILLQGTDSTNVMRAYVRPLDQVTAVPVPGTEGLRRAYWSPDGREIVFVAADKIQRAPIGGGSPTVICAAQGGVDVSWGSKGHILMDGRFTDTLRVVSASGGELRAATSIDRAGGEVGSGWPSFLPDGEHFLFIGNLRNSPGTGNMRLGKIGSLESKLLGTSDGRVEYAPGGWVVFLRKSTLMAQKLDVAAGKLIGEPITLTDGVRLGSAAGHFSVSPSGVLAFARETGGDAQVLREANREGDLTGPVRATGVMTNPRLSPDGRRLLYQRAAPGATGDGDVYVVDLERSTDTRLTFTGGSAATPEWSPDGRRFAYVNRPINGAARLRIAAADGLGTPDSLDLPAKSAGSLSQWIAAGSRLVFFTSDFRSYAVPTEGADRVATLLADTTQRLGHPQISPDGRWLSYSSGALPNVHVYVQSLTGTPGRWQVSTSPGFQARWAKGGRELIYETFTEQLCSVEVDGGESFRAGTPRVMFKLPVVSNGVDQLPWTFDSNAERFFLLTPVGVPQAGVVEVVTDFSSLVNRK